MRETIYTIHKINARAMGNIYINITIQALHAVLAVAALFNLDKFVNF